MPDHWMQSAVNVSEGRRVDVIHRIVEAASASGAIVADWSSDPDHNRSVITVIGPQNRLVPALIALTRESIDLIDLRQHSGCHPRMGVVDVVPLAPVLDTSMDLCRHTASLAASELAKIPGICVYLYEQSARSGRPCSLPEIRRRFDNPNGVEFPPDFGGPVVNPAIGATVVGARRPLAAYNVMVSGGVEVAKSIAREIRLSRDYDPDLCGVRALGMWLPSRNVAQVSMNLTEVDRVTLPGIFTRVDSLARAHHERAVESEVIGVIPDALLGGMEPRDIKWVDFRERQLLESHCSGS